MFPTSKPDFSTEESRVQSIQFNIQLWPSYSVSKLIIKGSGEFDFRIFEMLSDLPLSIPPGLGSDTDLHTGQIKHKISKLS